MRQNWSPVLHLIQANKHAETKNVTIRCRHFYASTQKIFAFWSDPHEHIDIKISSREITDLGKCGQEPPEKSHLWQTLYEIFISLTLSQIIVLAEKALELRAPCSEQTRYSFTECQYSTWLFSGIFRVNYLYPSTQDSSLRSQGIGFPDNSVRKALG